MVQRLDTSGEDRKPEQVRREFDHSLNVSRWVTPITETKPEEPRPDGAPDWWVSDEEASQSFLTNMGVAL